MYSKLGVSLLYGFKLHLLKPSCISWSLGTANWYRKLAARGVSQWAVAATGTVRCIPPTTRRTRNYGDGPPPWLNMTFLDNDQVSLCDLSLIEQEHSLLLL